MTKWQVMKRLVGDIETWAAQRRKKKSIKWWLPSHPSPLWPPREAPFSSAAACGSRAEETLGGGDRQTHKNGWRSSTDVWLCPESLQTDIQAGYCSDAMASDSIHAHSAHNRVGQPKQPATSLQKFDYQRIFTVKTRDILVWVVH